MYAVLGENSSDAETVKVLIHRLAKNHSLQIKPFGYNGCAEMLRKGARQLRAFADLGYTKFIVCYDADRDDPKARHDEVIEKVIKPSGIGNLYCVLIPVQEIEAWILADIEAVTQVFPSWRPNPITQNPETIDDPKEHLEKLSRANNRKPIYDHETHNRVVAQYLRLDQVRRRCPSFQPLVNFILNME